MTVAMVDEAIDAVRSIIDYNLIHHTNKSMNCETHFQQIKFVCQSDSCYFLPLCEDCHKDHSKKHKRNQVLPISKALQLASNNLLKQKQAIDQLLQPFGKRKILVQKIQDQKRQLRKEKDRLIKYVEDHIEQQIKKLSDDNRSINLNPSEKQLQNDLQEKLQEIDSLLANYRKKTSSLQQSLNFQIDKFLQGLSKNHSSIYGTTQFKYYSSVTHQIMLSKLETTSQNSTTKPFRKIMNESPLYFLIDSKFNSSNYLFNFNINKRQIQLYNVIDQQWSNYHAKQVQLCEKGCGVHDPLKNTFFWIGGIKSSKKSNSIVVFSPDQIDKNQRWRQVQLRTARSSCMACIVKTKDLSGNVRSGILIVGGFGQKGQILKSCEYLDLQTFNVFNFGQTNFAAFSGNLIVFNGSTILRLGGLGKNRNDYSVVEVVQKLDCQQAMNSYEKDKKQPRWSYIELQLPKGEYMSKPKLFYANQASIQINPNEVFVFGGLDLGMKGVTQSYLIGIQQFITPSRQIRERVATKQQRFSVRWVNQKPLISADDFSGLKPIIWKERLFTLQNIGKGEMVDEQKRLLEFDMYQWYETQSVLP